MTMEHFYDNVLVLSNTSLLLLGTVLASFGVFILSAVAALFVQGFLGLLELAMGKITQKAGGV